jgi:alkanesulfonate monooxygenase SsuD/methylene tetrahydromethanopterin reductase-like flavin-dependent oxidoreductase (luciferase family)
VEFGTFTGFAVREGQSEHAAFQEGVEFAEAADRLGVDCFWLAEFHFRPHTPLSAPLVVGSALAARTQRLKIGLGVQLLPLANPLHLAEEAATLDHLSGGRFVYGIGRSSFVDGYQGFGINYDESRPMFFEALEVLRRAWGDQPFSFEGQYYRFHDVNVVPKPYQRPHPPIRVACESRASFGLMGTLGFPILIRHQIEIAELQDLLAEYQRERHAAGFEGPNQVTLQANCYLAETAEQARSEPEASTMYERRLLRARIGGREGDQEASARLAALRADASYQELLGLGRLLYGTPEAIADRLREYAASLGITAVCLNMNPGGQIPRERVLNSLRLLMERVAPAVN